MCRRVYSQYSRSFQELTQNDAPHRGNQTYQAAAYTEHYRRGQGPAPTSQPFFGVKYAVLFHSQETVTKYKLTMICCFVMQKIFPMLRFNLPLLNFRLSYFFYTFSFFFFHFLSFWFFDRNESKIDIKQWRLWRRRLQNWYQIDDDQSHILN